MLATVCYAGPTLQQHWLWGSMSPMFWTRPQHVQLFMHRTRQPYILGQRRLYIHNIGQRKILWPIFIQPWWYNHDNVCM